MNCRWETLPEREKERYPYTEEFIAFLIKLVDDLDKKIKRGYDRLDVEGILKFMLLLLLILFVGGTGTNHDAPVSVDDLPPDLKVKMNQLQERIQVLLKQVSDSFYELMSGQDLDFQAHHFFVHTRGQ